jgi:hypothetical protein
LKRRGGLARARSRTDNFKPLIDAGIAASRKRSTLCLLTKLARLGFECEHTRVVLARLSS